MILFCGEKPMSIRWEPRGEGSNPRKGGNSRRLEFVSSLY